MKPVNVYPYPVAHNSDMLGARQATQHAYQQIKISIKASWILLNEQYSLAVFLISMTLAGAGPQGEGWTAED